MIRIRTDEKLFLVSKKNINKYPESEISKMIFSTDIDSDYIHKEEKDGIITLYIDVDPNIMMMIIQIMRLGPITINNLIKEEYDSLKLTLEMLNLSSLLENEKIIEPIVEENKLEQIFKSYNQENNIDIETNDFTELGSNVKENLKYALSSQYSEKKNNLTDLSIDNDNDNDNDKNLPESSSNIRRKLKAKIISVETDK